MTETNYWKAIRDRLHEESGLHYPRNQMGILFETFFNKMLNQFSDDNELFVDQGFLITTEGIYLDIRGEEMGLPRIGGKYAEGVVTFTLTHKVPAAEHKPLENEEKEGVIYDFRPEEVQTLLDEMNTEKGNVNTIIEARKASSDFLIPSGISIYSDTGFEYQLIEDVVFKKGSEIASGKVRAKYTGERYNAPIKSLNIFETGVIDADLSENTVEIIDQKSMPKGYALKTGYPTETEKQFEIIVNNKGEPVYKEEDGKIKLKPVYNETDGTQLDNLNEGESITTAIFQTKYEYIDNNEQTATLNLPTKEIKINGTTTTKEILLYTDENTYRFLTYLKTFKNGDINTDLKVWNLEEIQGGVDAESDEEYRTRLINNVSTNISVNYLRRQRILLYAKPKLNNDVRIHLTSFNPYLSNKYECIPPNDELREYCTNELIANDNIIVYYKGW